MKNVEVVDIFKDILFNRNQFNGGDASYSYDEETETFYDESHETEFQVRDYTNGDFHMILMRFCDDKTHTYIELYSESFNDDIYEMIYYALDEGVEELERRTIKAMERKRNG